MRTGRVKFQLVGCLAVAVLLGATASCSGDKAVPMISPSAAPPTTPATMPVDPGATRSQPPPVPTYPNSRQQEAYLTALETIDPALNRDEGRAVKVGYNLCLHLHDSNRRSFVVRIAQNRLDIDTATATRVVDAANRHICPLEKLA